MQQISEICSHSCRVSSSDIVGNYSKLSQSRGHHQLSPTVKHVTMGTPLRTINFQTHRQVQSAQSRSHGVTLPRWRGQNSWKWICWKRCFVLNSNFPLCERILARAPSLIALDKLPRWLIKKLIAHVKVKLLLKFSCVPPFHPLSPSLFVRWYASLEARRWIRRGISIGIRYANTAAPTQISDVYYSMNSD